jgi:hypothetical protein
MELPMASLLISASTYLSNLCLTLAATKTKAKAKTKANFIFSYLIITQTPPPLGPLK